MDVKNVFLNEDLSEDVYMFPPLGFSYSSCEVCKLQKVLYGLKQTPQAQFEKFSSVICDLGIYYGDHDSVLFLRFTSASQIVLLLNVDDMIIIGVDSDGISLLETQLQQKFEIGVLFPRLLCY